MEKYTMFMDWKNQYSENEYTTQSNLQIQCNPYQATSIFYFWSLVSFTTRLYDCMMLNLILNLLLFISVLSNFASSTSSPILLIHYHTNSKGSKWCFEFQIMHQDDKYFNLEKIMILSMFFQLLFYAKKSLYNYIAYYKVYLFYSKNTYIHSFVQFL